METGSSSPEGDKMHQTGEETPRSAFGNSFEPVPRVTTWHPQFLIPVYGFFNHTYLMNKHENT